MTSKHTKYTTSPRSGFTLVEIMIVVVILGLLAAMALPAFHQARNNSYATALANDFRVFAGAFEIYALESGGWPEDGIGNVLPVGVRPYFKDSAWYETPRGGGYWDWEFDRHGFVASIALAGIFRPLDPAVYQRIDEILDDGDLSTGLFQKEADRYLYILQE